MILYLFSGFLGSGKTTFVTSLAKHLVADKNEKVMMIVNDVGDIGIDAQLMKTLETDVYEIFGGCICGQIGNLVTLLKDVDSKYFVDKILLEASGIAQPVRFVDTIQKFGPKDMVIKNVTIVDAVRWLDLRQVVDELLVSQIMSADLVLVNKTDAVTEEILAEVIADIQEIDKNKQIVKISAKDFSSTLKAIEVMENE